MKENSFKRRFLLLIVVVLLTLTACERPVPREDTPETVDQAPTTEVIVIPTAPPEANDAYPATGTDTDQTGEPALTDETSETGDTAVTPEATTTEETTETTDASTDQEGGEVTHVVQSGETLGTIAEFYHVSIEDIAAANNITNIDVLEVGQTLIIKAGAAAEAGTTDTTTPSDSGGEQTHVVQAGENLFRIGLRYGFTAEELAAYNNIPDITRIDVGQIIKIPAK